MSCAPLALSADRLVRRSGARCVVNELSLRLHRGEVVGLLGHNGAGKSTTLQMLAGVLTPHAGTIDICGFDLGRQPREAKAHVGFLPEVPPLYGDMRVDDYLVFAARLRRIPRTEVASALADAKRRCGLENSGRNFIGALSKGYQQRVGIAQAIIHEPEVIILDEPTVGLDLAQLRDVRALIRELGGAHSVILSTHLLDEAEALCDRIEIMRSGYIAYSGGAPERDGSGQMKLEELLMHVTEAPAASGALNPEPAR